MFNNEYFDVLYKFLIEKWNKEPRELDHFVSWVENQFIQLEMLSDDLKQPSNSAELEVSLDVLRTFKREFSKEIKPSILGLSVALQKDSSNESEWLSKLPAYIKLLKQPYDDVWFFPIDRQHQNTLDWYEVLVETLELSVRKLEKFIQRSGVKWVPLYELTDSPYKTFHSETFPAFYQNFEEGTGKLYAEVRITGDKPDSYCAA